MPVERRGPTGHMREQDDGRTAWDRKILTTVRPRTVHSSPVRGERWLHGQAGGHSRMRPQPPVHAAERECPGEPDAGKPHVRFEEGGRWTRYREN